MAEADNTAPEKMAGEQNTAPEVQEAPLSKRMGVPTTGVEGSFYSNFMNPMFAKMEESVKKNNEMLDEIHRKMEEDNEMRRRERLSRHIPGPLQGKGRAMDEIMKHIQDLVIYENYRDDEDPAKKVPARLKALDGHADVAILGHSIAAYVSTLELVHLRTFITRIVSDTTLWVSRLFRFSDASAYFHEDEREGLVRVARLALHRKFPKLNTDGYEAMYSRPPVIYISAAAKPGLGLYLCSQLGVPLSCLSTVPVNLNAENPYAMDVAELEKFVEEDKASAKTPALVIAYAGTPLTGHVDNIDRINEISKANDMWVHVEGNNLATLAMYSVPTAIAPAKSGDSMTLNLSAWLGLPAIPFITLYKTADPAMAHTVGLTTIQAKYKLHSLPIWLCLQSLGHEGVVNRVKFSRELAEKLTADIQTVSTLKIVSKKRKVGDRRVEKLSLSELIQKAISALVLFEIDNPTLVFKYEPKVNTAAASVDVGGAGDGEMTDPIPHDPYHDALNLWLSETMKREVPRVHTSTVEVEGEGVCIRFCPLETAHTYDTTEEDVEDFFESLRRQLTILDATVEQKETFAEVVEAQDNMRLVTLPNWAGLGAVQYIPEEFLSKLDDLSEDQMREINRLNTQLVHQLKSSDTAFSLGVSSEGMGCVRFGLITEETDLEELIALVYTTGKEVEESLKFIETMSDVVKQGIIKANEDLEKENQEKLMQEGVLRQVPLVGSLLNWWSPPPSEQIGVKGRTFNLASGKIDSTEKTYKYHMQVQDSPQTPSRPQGPLKAALKPTKRRLTSSGSVDHTVEDSSESARTPEPQGDAASQGNEEPSQNHTPAGTSSEQNHSSAAQPTNPSTPGEQPKAEEAIDLK